MKNFNVIAIKNKEDVLKAAKLFKKIGIEIFESKESEDKFIKTGDNVKNNFLIKNEDGWRIQSHFLGNGLPVDELEKQINELTKAHPTLKNQLKELSKLKKELQHIKQTITEIEERLKKLI